MRVSITALIALVALPAFTQINGAVQDDRQRGIPFANVILYQSADSTFITGLSTADDGQFSIDHCTPGRYLPFVVQKLAARLHDFRAVERNNQAGKNVTLKVYKPPPIHTAPKIEPILNFKS